MADDLVSAVWNGPFDGELPSGALLVRGASYDIPRHQAEGSDHWTIPSPEPAPAQSSTPSRPRRFGPESTIPDTDTDTDPEKGDS